MLGGVTTFLFAAVMASGARVLSYLKWDRRDRFILGAAFSFGIGDLLSVFTFCSVLFCTAAVGADRPSAVCRKSSHTCLTE